MLLKCFSLPLLFTRNTRILFAIFSSRNSCVPHSGTHSMRTIGAREIILKYRRALFTGCAFLSYRYQIKQRIFPFAELNNCSWQWRCRIYVSKTKRMHTFLNNLFHLIYPRLASKQVTVHHQVCTSSLQSFILHLKRSLVANTIWMVLNDNDNDTALINNCLLEPYRG